MTDAFENEKLQTVSAFLAAELKRLRDHGKKESREVRERTRDYMAENPFAAVYGRNAGFMRETNERIKGVEETYARIRVLEDMAQAPYFGRVDFLYEDEDVPEPVYIGISTLLDRETGDILVYDWRAPVSSLFYNGEKGPASYVAPMGEIRGEITRIRQYRFEKGKLMSYWDADVQIDDVLLCDALAAGATEHMKTIVCTIQREQNAAIRFARDRDLIVLGPAGSGKTSVGMHRLAWILYQQRLAGLRENVLMFTANEAFRSYVSGVLPQLGEQEIDTLDFAELFEKYLPGWVVEPYLQQAGALLEGDEKRKRSAAAVYAPAFSDYIDERLRTTPLRFKDVRLYDDTILTAAALRARFLHLPSNVSVRKRLSTLADWAVDEVENYFLIHKRELQNRVLNDMESGESYTLLYRSLRQSASDRCRSMVLGAVRSDPAALYLDCLGAFYGEEDFVSDAKARIGEKKLHFEDAVTMLYIAVSLGQAAVSDSAPSHVLVDEAQDFCAPQHRILRRLFPKAVFTVLADLHQGNLPEANVRDEETLKRVYGENVLRLKKSYRQTRQLSAFSKRYLSPADADFETFDRDGPEPFVYRTKKPAGTTAGIVEELLGRFGSVGVLLRTAEEAAAFYRSLPPEAKEKIRPVFSGERSLPSGAAVLPSTLAKGLEFDAVVLPHAETLEEDPRTAYLLTTRALHELHLVYTEKKVSRR